MSAALRRAGRALPAYAALLKAASLKKSIIRLRISNTCSSVTLKGFRIPLDDCEPGKRHEFGHCRI